MMSEIKKHAEAQVFQAHIAAGEWYEAASMVEPLCQTPTVIEGTDVLQDWMSAGSWDGIETPESVAREWDELRRND